LLAVVFTYHQSLLENRTSVSILGHQDTVLKLSDWLQLKKNGHGFFKKLKSEFIWCRFDVSSYLLYRQFKKIKNQFTGLMLYNLSGEKFAYCSYFHEKNWKHLLFNSENFLLSLGWHSSSVKILLYKTYLQIGNQRKAFIRPNKIQALWKRIEIQNKVV
jgi:hypothetical protein